MSLIFVDGFDHYQHPLQKWDQFVLSGNAGPLPRISPTLGRNGNGCLVFPARSTSGSVSSAVQKNFTNLATVFCGFAFWLDYGTATHDYTLLAWLDGGTTQVDLRVNQSGHLYFTRNGTTIGAQSTNSLSFRTWHYIEVKVTIDPSAGVAVLNVDGVNTGWLNLTAQNTRASAISVTGAVKVGLFATPGTETAPSALLDDFYLANTSGSFNNSFLGDVKVQGLMPTGNGTSSQYTQNEASWVGSTVEFIGHTIKDSNGNIQVITAVTSDAKTGVGAPTWSTGVGATTADNHVTWTCLGPSSQYLDVNENPPEGSGQRLAGVAVAVGTSVWDNNGNLELCTTAGTTSGSLDFPTWNLTVGGTTTDGTVTWTNLGIVEDTFLSDATIGHISRFTFPSIVASSIQAVAVTMRARKDDASVRSIRGAALSGGTAGDNGTDLVMTTNSQMVQGIIEADPNTGAAWTASAVNAAEFGVKTTA